MRENSRIVGGAAQRINAKSAIARAVLALMLLIVFAIVDSQLLIRIRIHVTIWM
jgi:hypothetical protein